MIKSLVTAGLVALTAGAASANIGLSSDAWNLSHFQITNFTDRPDGACSDREGGKDLWTISLPLGGWTTVIAEPHETYEIIASTDGYGGKSECFKIKGNGNVKTYGTLFETWIGADGNLQVIK